MRRHRYMVPGLVPHDVDRTLTATLARTPAGMVRDWPAFVRGFAKERARLCGGSVSDAVREIHDAAPEWMRQKMGAFSS